MKEFFLNSIKYKKSSDFVFYSFIIRNESEDDIKNFILTYLHPSTPLNTNSTSVPVLEHVQ